MAEKKYGLFTAIAMIVGIVIGSGIFFKSDNILVATGGSISLGILVFCIAAISIIFGSLTIAELASRNTHAGGIITYAECSSKSLACVFGWFHTFLYYPTLVAVVSWVTGIYSCILFGIEGKLETQILIGFGAVILLFILNILSAKLGGYFQNAATIIKLIPLILIAILGMTFGNPGTISGSDITNMQSAGWITAIAPIAFAFDGWIVSTSISHEIKNAKRNLPLALICAPLFILVLYILYFAGISMYIGPDQVMSLGDAHVDLAANNLFGAWGAKAILVFVIISVLGTVNGLIMGLIRLPYSLALRNMFPNAKKIAHVSEKLDIPVASAAVGFGLSVIWIIIHYVTQKFGLLPNSDISEISITINYVLYIFLYIHVFKMGVHGDIKGFWRGKINPIMATIGSLIILWGGMQNPLFLYYTGACVLFIIASLVFWKRKSSSIEN